ncbi:hypothetical protein GCM10011496_24380 [Polaromonas eurypsychrophila]|uniref:Uncharacterized protein n=1 Tax=Polaromonas eurypsychrophila TaxID=1614635 RepID=A0A916WHS7_9BURK|nr:hypothetical protein GCM10011496_24380 [Polaromonas eurypsychrophila]
MMRMPTRIVDKSIQTLTRRCQHLGAVAKHWAMAGYNRARSQVLDQVKCCRDFVKSITSLELGKDYAKTTFPQSVGRNQGTGLWFKENDRIRIMAWCGMNLPKFVGEFDFAAWRYYAGELILGA